jgi:hypothetical protein
MIRLVIPFTSVVEFSHDAEKITLDLRERPEAEIYSTRAPEAEAEREESAIPYASSPSETGEESARGKDMESPSDRLRRVGSVRESE